MNYFQKISKLAECVSTDIVDFSGQREPVRTPTQASSNFLTNKEQGDWAEALIFEAVNKYMRDYVAVKYGKSDDIAAGEDGFDDFYQAFQEELDTIGKRPDILIFKKQDFQADLGRDISKYDIYETKEYVKKAIMGIEVRSSSFLIDKYTHFMSERINQCTKEAMNIKKDLSENYNDVFKINPNRQPLFEIINSITPNNLNAIDFKIPGWRADARSLEANDKLKKLKECIKTIQKREFLSITPKVEDILVVYKWVEIFGVPHYYFQVFFDKIFGISFEDILSLIGDSSKEGEEYYIETDTKNQNKTTIKINAFNGFKVADKVTEPEHKSKRKELDRGRLLYFVTFSGGEAYLNVDLLEKHFKQCESEK